jgi:hypothetical protein
VTLLAHTNLKCSEKAVYRALFLNWDYNIKSQISKKLPGKSKNFNVSHKHEAGNCKNGPARAMIISCLP